MSRASTSRGLLIGVIAGVVITVTAVVYVSTRQPETAHTKPSVSVGAAMSAVRDFVGEPNLKLIQTADAPIGGRLCYEFATPDLTMSFKVDKESGAVRGAFFGGLGKKGTLTSEQEAVTVAKRFSRERRLAVPDIDPTVTHVGDEESQFEVYLVEWQETRDGVKLPPALQVGVNARSGEVVSFEWPEAPGLPDLSARVGRDEAVSQARAKTPFAAKTVDAQLEVWPTDGVPRLRWRIELTGLTPVEDGFISRTASVIIDAKTGEVLETYVR
ncbi:MAG: PepSY domain-containing protein [Coriobacteriia bacterium]|nr:PepSY domain-containing protein [Coriobacteriia bacterium]